MLSQPSQAWWEHVWTSSTCGYKKHCHMGETYKNSLGGIDIHKAKVCITGGFGCLLHTFWSESLGYPVVAPSSRLLGLHHGAM